MSDHQPRPGSIFPPPDVDDEHYAMLEDLHDWARSSIVWDVRFGRGECYLPLSWLGSLFRTAKRLDGDTRFQGDPPTERERLVAILNRVDDVDVGAVLASDDPAVEIEAVHAAIATLREEG